jgi:hypothetical protein
MEKRKGPLVEVVCFAVLFAPFQLRTSEYTIISFLYQVKILKSKIESNVMFRFILYAREI